MVNGLPPDAATWRKSAFPPAEEFLAQMLERSHAWNQSLLSALMGAKKVSFPADVQIYRPDDERLLAPRVETDPTAIAQWFTQNMG